MSAPQHLQQSFCDMRIGLVAFCTLVKGEALQPLQILSNPKTAKTKKSVAQIDDVMHLGRKNLADNERGIVQ
jgi:hypothetical protein